MNVSPAGAVDGTHETICDSAPSFENGGAKRGEESGREDQTMGLAPESAEVMLTGGETAQAGIAAGPVVHVHESEWIDSLTALLP